MPDQACDVGCLPLSKDEIVVFGGWNKQATTNAYILKRTEIPATFTGKPQDKHELKHMEGGLDKPDFFLVSGFASKTENAQVVKVCGHSQLFSFDMKLRKFVGSSNVWLINAYSDCN